MILAEAQEAQAAATQETDGTRRKRLALKGHKDFSLCPFVFILV